MHPFDRVDYMEDSVNGGLWRFMLTAGILSWSLPVGIAGKFIFDWFGILPLDEDLVEYVLMFIALGCGYACVKWFVLKRTYDRLQAINLDDYEFLFEDDEYID
ncbi:hypothetical protein OCL06_01205 [Alteromonas sp. ASW11-19]|uniref:Uncharacterized protein n=1 Tax=Alteromonas salexigens TaxID=2982530 RepID=A0ABT2VJ32_9ALTE|nr:hypothetical protein [Alteromonas salexigens]MCU7553210.1 hypothetical protein [Alteromonas salexigens]